MIDEKYKKIVLAIEEYEKVRPTLSEFIDKEYRTYRTDFLIELFNFLKDLNYKEKIAIVGDFGSGKTHLRYMLSKYFPHLYFTESIDSVNELQIRVSKEFWMELKKQGE